MVIYLICAKESLCPPRDLLAEGNGKDVTTLTNISFRSAPFLNLDPVIFWLVGVGVRLAAAEHLDICDLLARKVNKI